MRRMNLAVGSLTLVGLLFGLAGVLSKVAGIALLYPLVKEMPSYFIIACTCFLLALIVDRFDGTE